MQIMFMLKGLKEMSSGMILKMKKILQFCFKNKKQKCKHVWQHDHKFRQVQLLAEEKSRQRIEETTLMEHILNALSISIKSVTAKQAHRSTYNVARTLTMFIVDFLKGYDVDV